MPIYTRRIPNLQNEQGRYNLYYLADIPTKQRRAVRLLAITHDNTVTEWTPEQTRDYILDRTAEAMKTVMLHEHKYSPLRRWTDTSWYYTWSEEQRCCLILSYIEVAHDDIRMQRPTNYAWLRMPQELEDLAERQVRGSLQPFGMSTTYTEELLKTGVMEQGSSPSKPPKKKTKGHSISIHTDITRREASAKSQERELVQGGSQDSFNFEA